MDWIKRREERGAYVNIVNELGAEDSYKEMMRMDHSTFCTILRYIEKDITPNELASGINIISTPERIVLTILYFTTGETFRSLSFQFRLSRNAISSIVSQVSKAFISNM